MSKLSQLQQFISREDIKTDPFWRSILQSDSRNIFPKYELAKIELAKNKINKLRLIMDQLPHFLSLQIYAKKMEKLAKSVQEKDVKKDVEELSRQCENFKKQTGSNDYQFEVLQAKEKVEYFCSQMNKPTIKPQLKQLLVHNQKWKAYLQANVKQLKYVDPVLKQKDRCQLAKVIELQRVDESLTYGTSGKIIQERVKEEVFQHRLKQIFQKGLDPVALEIPEDPWSAEWQELVVQLNEPSDYV